MQMLTSKSDCLFIHTEHNGSVPSSASCGCTRVSMEMSNEGYCSHLEAIKQYLPVFLIFQRHQIVMPLSVLASSETRKYSFPDP